MSETLKKQGLDGWLREWPDAEKAATDWEEMARKIDERVALGAPGATVASVSNEELFADPLGQIEGDGHNSAAPVKTGETRVSKGEMMTMPADRERDRRSLQDLAKLAATGMTPPPPVSVSMPSSSGSLGAPSARISTSVPGSVPSSVPSGVQRAAEAKKDDSGIVDLAMASQADPQAAVRAQTTPLASGNLFEDDAPPPSQLQQPAPTMPSASVSAPISLAPEPSVSASLPLGQPQPAFSVESSAHRIAPQKKKKGSGAVVALVLGVVAMGSMAAGGFFYMKHRAETAAAQLAANDAKLAAPVAIAAPKPAETAAAAPAPEPTVDPNALPNGDTSDTTAAKVAAAPKGAPKAAAPHAAAAAPKEEAAAKLSQKDLPTAAAAPEGDLGKAMGKAVGADGKPIEVTPAAGNTGPQFAAGTVPQKPSQGAVTGAIGAVLPGARACLGPDDPVSRAAITFTSSGSVQGVNVSGGAAGKPAEGCIKAALGKAKIAPFAEPTYTANITVRH